MQLTVIQQKIYELRGHKVMLDFDLSGLYEVETKVLNQAVRRNIGRFPKDFMFRLSKKEWNSIRSKLVVNSVDLVNWSQIVTSSRKHRGIAYLPYAFTEHGVTMLASILRSKKAVKMNIAVVRAFIALRQYALHYKELTEQINEIRQSVTNHNEQLNQIYDAIENLLATKEEQQTWKDRERIGFKK